MWLVILLVILILLLLQTRNQKCDKSDTIKTLVRQAARWSVAAQQDENPMIAVLHANYGAGYLWALKDIATDDEIEKATGIDVLKFRDEIVKVQDFATRKAVNACPEFGPATSYLTQLIA
jgi:hypothetical protein